MAAAPFRLSVIIGASTTEATSALHALETQLHRLSGAGGLKGLAAGGAAGGLAAVRTGVSGLGSALSTVTMAFPALGTAGKLVFGALALPINLVSGLVRGLVGVVKGIGTAFSAVFGVAKYALMGIGAALGAVAAGVYAAVKALGPAAFREKSLVSWEVLLGSPKKAEQRMGFLQKFEAQTPFDFREVDQGARLMQTFGIYSERTLKAVGNAVSAFGKRIDDAVGPLAKLKAGLFETEQMGVIGITRDSLRKEGVKFDKQGTMLTPGTVAFEAAIRSFEKRFGGMMDRVSQTWDGLMSTLGSSWDNLWATLGKNALGPAKRVLREVIGGIDDIATRLKGFTIPGLEKAVIAAKMLRTLVGDLFDQQERGRLLGIVTDTAKKVPGFAVGLGEALLGDLGTLLGNFVTNLGPAFSLFGDVFVGAGRVFIAMLKEAWSGMSKEARDNILAAISPDEAKSQITAYKGIVHDEAENAVKGDVLREPERRKALAAWIHDLNSSLSKRSMAGNELANYTAGAGGAGLRSAGIDTTALLARIDWQWRTSRGYERQTGAIRLSPSAEEQTRLHTTLGGMVTQMRELGANLGKGFGEKLDQYLFGKYQQGVLGQPGVDAQGRKLDANGKPLHAEAGGAVRSTFGEGLDEAKARYGEASGEVAAQNYINQTREGWIRLLTPPAPRDRYGVAIPQTLANEKTGEQLFAQMAPWLSKALAERGRMAPSEAREVLREARGLAMGNNPQEAIRGALRQAQGREVTPRQEGQLKEQFRSVPATGLAAEVRETPEWIDRIAKALRPSEVLAQLAQAAARRQPGAGGAGGAGGDGGDGAAGPAGRDGQDAVSPGSAPPAAVPTPARARGPLRTRLGWSGTQTGAARENRLAGQWEGEDTLLPRGIVSSLRGANAKPKAAPKAAPKLEAPKESNNPTASAWSAQQRSRFMEGQYPETSGTGEASWEPDSYSPPPGSAQNRPYTAGRFAWQDAVDAAYGISRPRGISSVMHGAKGGASKPQEPWARAYSEVSAPRRQPLATPARTSKETPDAGKERDREHDTRFGFRLPDNFESLMRMSPRQRDRARRDAREDGVLSSKLAKLAAGENVGFTLGEKRRLGEAGGHVPRPRWAAEQDRVRAGSPDLASMGKHRLGDLSENRIGMQTTESKNQQPPWAQAQLQEMRRQTALNERAVEELGRISNMVGVK